MQKGLLFLNGDRPSHDTMQNADFTVPVFCADGAYAYLKEFCEPDVLIGDFDSLDALLLKKLRADKNCIKQEKSCKPEIIAYGAAKNFTDGFLALKTMLARGFDQIDIYGALGGRPDHEASNYLLLSLALTFGVEARFVTDSFTVHLIDRVFMAKVKIGATVSLVPFSDNVHILYTKGLKYPINNLVMSKIHGLANENYIMGVSNCAVKESIEYGIDDGIALVYLEKQVGR